LSSRYIARGIKKNYENQEKIFEQYYTTKKGRAGTGLGLHIVEKIIVEKLQESIVLNDQGKGLVF